MIKPREYVIYFKWKCEPIPDINNGYSKDYYHQYDGSEDSIIVETAAERDANIKDMIKRNDFEYIAWCQIYSDGEYGSSHVVLDSRK